MNMRSRGFRAIAFQFHPNFFVACLMKVCRLWLRRLYEVFRGKRAIREAVYPIRSGYDASLLIELIKQVRAAPKDILPPFFPNPAASFWRLSRNRNRADRRNK